MIECRIDGVVVPLLSKSIKMPTYDARKLHSIEAWRQGFDVEIEVVSTPQSDEVMHYAFDLNRGVGFNDELHKAQLLLDGTELYSGMVTLLGTEHSASVRSYRLRLRSGGSEWADMVARTALKSSDIEIDMRLLPTDIEASWYGDVAVRYLPLRRDSYPIPEPNNAWAEHRVLMPNDYHPFISIRHLLRSMAAKAGYTIYSRWLESDIARRLMISGQYRQLQSDAAERDMGFKAYRSFDYTAEANSGGFVFATEPKLPSHVGAIVDCAMAVKSDDGGTLYADAYNNGALGFVDGQPLFTPLRDVSVAFEYKLRYITDYRIVSSTRLKGFNRIRLGPFCDIEVVLENTFENKSSNLLSNRAYKLFIFDYDASHEYRLEGIGNISEAVSDIVTPEGYEGPARLMVRSVDGDDYVSYNGDWAIYNGYVEATGRQEIELTVRTPYQYMTASTNEQFHGVIFYGADAGQRLTLCSGCSLRPLFSGSVGYGDVIGFEDIANHNISQQQLLEAIAQMFNLCFYSHEPSKSIIIEPYDDFFESDVVDWRTRQLSNSWSLVEGAPRCFEHTRLEYIAGDGVVARNNELTDREFGIWTKSVEGYGTKRGVDVRTNPLFRPTISLTGYMPHATSAEILTVGDRDVVTQSEAVEPRVVLYHGMAELSPGEHWNSSSNTHLYPHVSFHSAQSGYTLCFEDRDGCKGLHRYYDTELAEAAERGELHCKIRIPMVEYIGLFDPHSSQPTIRSIFRLEVDGAESLFRLRAIESYDYEKGVATCLFSRILRDC